MDQEQGRHPANGSPDAAPVPYAGDLCGNRLHDVLCQNDVLFECGQRQGCQVAYLGFRRTGAPWRVREIGLSQVTQELVVNKLRHNIRFIKVRSGRNCLQALKQR